MVQCQKILQSDDIPLSLGEKSTYSHTRHPVGENCQQFLHRPEHLKPHTLPSWLCHGVYIHPPLIEPHDWIVSLPCSHANSA